MPANLNNPFDPSCCDGGATSGTESCQPCGCDMGAKPPHYCERHRLSYTDEIKSLLEPYCKLVDDTVKEIKNTDSDDKQWRKERPVYSGVIAYFPDALLEVAYVSFKGNEQHNPGQPLHWAREKSTDQLDCVVRHLIDHAKGVVDDNGMGLHLAKVAWRALAELQLFLESKK